MAAAAARVLLADAGAELSPTNPLADIDTTGVTPPPDLDAAATPSLLGEVYQAASAAADRRSGGRHYTPDWLATGLVGLAFGDGCPALVFDPASGGGAFLVAAADEMVRRGVPPARVGERLAGVDVDPWAVAVSRAALGLWAARLGEAEPRARLAVGDGLVGSWPDTVEVVVGNPPFLSPLRRGNQRSGADADAIEAATGVRPGPYTDVAALFVARAVAAVAPGGRVALVLPMSVATARDAAGVRGAVASAGAVRAVWRDRGDAFAAGVETFCPVVERAAAPAPVRVIDGHRFDRSTVVPAAAGDDWAALLDDATPDGPASDRLMSNGDVVGDLATVTAGFRDEYYAVAAAVTEGAGVAVSGGGDRGGDQPRVVTSGLIDVGICHWGRRPARIARQRWQRPVAPLAAIDAHDPRIGRWARDRLAPKVVVATQTRVIEAAVDVDGRWLPITPVLSVQPRDPRDLVALWAALSAPPVSRWMARRRRGSGLSGAAMRISARDLAAVPLPAYAGAWRAATEVATAATPDPSDATIVEVAALMTRAYGAGTDALEWWNQRRPPVADRE